MGLCRFPIRHGKSPNIFPISLRRLKSPYIFSVRSGMNPLLFHNLRNIEYMILPNIFL